MAVLFSIVEGTTAARGPFKLWVQEEPEPLPPGLVTEVAPVALDLTGKTVALVLRRPDGTSITVTGVATPRNQTTHKGWFDFTPGASDFVYIALNNYTNVTLLAGHWRVVTTAGGAVDFWPDDQFEVEVRRA